MRNVLFIAVDDLRPELSRFGKSKLHSPHIDALCARGTQFDRAYCQYPQCMPSRASMLTGVRPTAELRDRKDQMCPNGEPSLPGHFRANGYQTVSIGKTYHYNDDDGESWSRRYDDTFYEQEYACHGYCSGYQDPENQRKVRNFGLQFASRNSHAGGRREPVELPPISESADAPDEAYPDGIVASRACRELADFAASNDPFFLAVGFYRPHLPWAVPERYWNLYDRNEVDLADNPFFPEHGIGISKLCDFLHYGDETILSTYSDIGTYDADSFPVLPPEKQRECVHGYWASVSFVDAQIGRVLAELERTGLSDDTVVVLWGDNGWHLGEHKLWSKVTSFEESTRVPLVVQAPDTSVGQRTDALVELVDIYPSLCELTAINTPAHVEGTSFVPLLGEPHREWKRGVLSRVRDAETLRTEKYRYTRYQAVPEGDAMHLPSELSAELFDLDSDPKENVNVAGRRAYSDVLEAMDEMLDGGWEVLTPERRS